MAHSGAPTFAKNSQAIKPSVSFMNLSREQAKIKHFVDLQDGPSSLQKREGVRTLKERVTHAKLCRVSCSAQSCGP